MGLHSLNEPVKLTQAHLLPVESSPKPDKVGSCCGAILRFHVNTIRQGRYDHVSFRGRGQSSGL